MPSLARLWRRLGLDDISRYREQFLYGHRELLLDYAGLPRSCLLAGRVQHGWDLDFEGTQRFRDWRGRSAWQWVWSRDAEERARKRGIPKVMAIGAPWLYLDAMAEERPMSSSQNPPARSTLFVPAHYGPYATKDMHEYHARVVGKEFSDGPVTVLLHAYDFIQPKVRQLYERKGGFVTCAGYPVHPPEGLAQSADLGHRVHFLWYLWSLFKSHERIATDFMGSHLFYATYLGKPIGYWAMPRRLWDDINRQQIRGDQALFNRMLAVETEWASELNGTFGKSDVLRLMTERVLGTSCFRTPAGLRDCLRYRESGLPAVGSWENPAPDPTSRIFSMT